MVFQGNNLFKQIQIFHLVKWFFFFFFFIHLSSCLWFVSFVYWKRSPHSLTDFNPLTTRKPGSKGWTWGRTRWEKVHLRRKDQKLTGKSNGNRGRIRLKRLALTVSDHYTVGSVDGGSERIFGPGRSSHRWSMSTYNSGTLHRSDWSLYSIHFLWVT